MQERLHSAEVWSTEITLNSPAWSKLYTALAAAMTVMTLHFWSWISADQTQLVKTADSLPGECSAAPSAVPGEN